MPMIIFLPKHFAEVNSNPITFPESEDDMTTLQSSVNAKIKHVDVTPLRVQPDETLVFQNHSPKYRCFTIELDPPDFASPGDKLEGDEQSNNNMWQKTEILPTRFDTIRRKARKMTQWRRGLLGLGLAPAAVINKELNRAGETFTHRLRSVTEKTSRPPPNDDRGGIIGAELRRRFRVSTTWRVA